LVYFKQGLKALAYITCYLVYQPPDGSSANMEKLAELLREAKKNLISICEFNLLSIGHLKRQKTAKTGGGCSRGHVPRTTGQFLVPIYQRKYTRPGANKSPGQSLRYQREEGRNGKSTPLNESGGTDNLECADP
jgi:hypothetical protein